MPTWTHTDTHSHTRQHTFYFNLAMLTYQSFLPCVEPLAAVSSYELWLHIPHNEAQMPQMQIWLCCCWILTRTAPVDQSLKTKTYKLKKDHGTWDISRKSSWRQWVWQKQKETDRAGGKGELKWKQLALISKSTLNRRQGLQLCVEKTTSLYSQKVDERNDSFQEQNIDRKICGDTYWTERWTGTEKERESKVHGESSDMFFKSYS